jgi:FtsZ-interacting cell division protein YlmF
MEGYCSTGQSPQRAVVPMEEEEEEEEEEKKEEEEEQQQQQQQQPGSIMESRNRVRHVRNDLRQQNDRVNGKFVFCQNVPWSGVITTRGVLSVFPVRCLGCGKHEPCVEAL